MENTDEVTFSTLTFKKTSGIFYSICENSPMKNKTRLVLKAQRKMYLHRITVKACLI